MQPFDTMDPFSKVLKKIFRNKFTRDSFHPSLDTHEQVSPQPSLTVAKEQTVLYNTMHFIHVIHHLKRWLITPELPNSDCIESSDWSCTN